jgi:hypothetical protein
MIAVCNEHCVNACIGKTRVVDITANFINVGFMM